MKVIPKHDPWWKLFTASSQVIQSNTDIDSEKKMLLLIFFFPVIWITSVRSPSLFCSGNKNKYMYKNQNDLPG